MPFPVRAMQVDGGAEFEAIFEEECQRRGIKLFVLPSRNQANIMVRLNFVPEDSRRIYAKLIIPLRC